MQAPGDRCLRVDQIVLFPAIVDDVVQFGAWHVDQLVVLRADDTQRCPTVVQQRIERLTVNTGPGPVGGALHARKQTGSVRGRGCLQAGGIEYRWQQVDMTGRVSHHPPGQSTGRRPDDQWDVDRRVVHEVAVEHLAVIAQAFAVVGREHEQRTIEQASLFERLPELADQCVGKRDRAIVGAACKCRLVRLWRPVRVVRVIEVEPKEERPAARALVEPPDRLRHGLVSCAPHRTDVCALHLGEVEIVEVAVESPTCSPLRIQHIGADEARRRPSLGSEHTGQRWRPLVEEVPDILADAMVRGIRAGQDRHVGRQGQRNRARGVREQHALACESIDVWRPYRR